MFLMAVLMQTACTACHMQGMCAGHWHKQLQLQCQVRASLCGDAPQVGDISDMAAMAVGLWGVQQAMHHQKVHACLLTGCQAQVHS